MEGLQEFVYSGQVGECALGQSKERSLGCCTQLVGSRGVSWIKGRRYRLWLLKAHMAAVQVGRVLVTRPQSWGILLTFCRFMVPSLTTAPSALLCSQSRSVHLASETAWRTSKKQPKNAVQGLIRPTQAQTGPQKAKEFFSSAEHRPDDLQL